MIGENKPYPELPYNWTIAQEAWWVQGEHWKQRYYGINRHTGEQTMRFKSYGEALRAVEAIELREEPK